jgi:hypothetical protein
MSIPSEIIRMLLKACHSSFGVMLITERWVLYPYRGHWGAIRIHIWPLPEIRYFRFQLNVHN